MNKEQLRQEIAITMRLLGFTYHVDVLNRFWEKGNFRDSDYIKMSDNAAAFLCEQLSTTKHNTSKE